MPPRKTRKSSKPTPARKKLAKKGKVGGLKAGPRFRKKLGGGRIKRNIKFKTPLFKFPIPTGPIEPRQLQPL